jgi:hypothetical protein
MMKKVFGRGRRGGVILIAGAVLGAAVAGPGMSIALNQMQGDKRYVLKGTTLAGGQTVETKIDKFNSSSFSPIATATINAPAAGFLQVVGDLSAKDDTSTTSTNGTKLDYRLSVGSTPLSNTADSFELFLPDLASPTLDQREDGGVNGVAKVAAKGPQKVTLEAKVDNANASATILGRSVSAVFLPKGKLPKTRGSRTGTGNTGTGNQGTGNQGTGQHPGP